MLKAVLFDLDGTLLPVDEKEFTNLYFEYLYEYLKEDGYEKEKLVSTIYGGIKQMYKNDGQKTNEEVFWDYFKQIYGDDKMIAKNKIDEFYITDFKKTKEACTDNPKAKEIVKHVKQNNLLCILATNPVFPYSGMLTRMKYIDLCDDDFDYITSYEKSCYTKPNPKYYLDILDKYNLKTDEVIMFGNNVLEDYIATKNANIKCYLVGDHIINKDNFDISNIKILKMDEIIKTIDKEIINK